LGLLISLATFAINLLIDIPAEAFKPVFLFIFFLISSAINVALRIPFLFCVTSKYASSNYNGSTLSVNS